jgi:hypothetical protein
MIEHEEGETMRASEAIAAGIIIALAVLLYLYTTHNLNLSFVPTSPAINNTVSNLTSGFNTGINLTQNAVRLGVNSIIKQLGS